MKKLLCALMACILVYGIFPTSYAETLLAYVAGNTLKVYQEANTTAKVLGTLREDTVITVLEVRGNWCRVKNNKGEIGYCQKSGLEKVWTGSAKGYVIAESLTVYASNSTSSKRLGTAYYGDTVTVIGATGNWCQLKHPNGAIGYCLQSGLSKTKPNTETSGTDNSETGKSETGKCWISYGGIVNVYADTSADKRIGTAGFGQSFTVVNASELWVCVRNDKNKVGYIGIEYVTAENPFKQSKTVYTQIGGKLLSAFGTGKTVGIKLEKNTALTWLATSSDGACCIVEYRGVKYYVKQPKLLNAQKAGSDLTYKITKATNLYQTNAVTQNILRELKVGDQIHILEYTDDGHYRVQTQDGTIGYCVNWAWNRVA